MEDKFDIMLYESLYAKGQCRFKKDGSSVCIQEWDDYYSVQTDPPFPDMVCELKTYYADTLTLRDTGKYLKKGNVRIGVWKNYDRWGNIENETDYDEGWAMNWDRFAPVLSEQTLDMKRIIGIHQSVTEVDGKMKRQWIISSLVSNRITLKDYYDGETGNKLMSKAEISEND